VLGGARTGVDVSSREQERTDPGKGGASPAATGAYGSTGSTPGGADPRSALAEEIFRERREGPTRRRSLGIALGAFLVILAVAGWLAYVQSQMPKDPLAQSYPMPDDVPTYVACEASQDAYGWALAPAGVDVYTTTGERITALRLDLVPPSGGTPYAMPAGQKVLAAVVTGTDAELPRTTPATGGDTRMMALYAPDGTTLTSGADQVYLEGDVPRGTDLRSLGTPVHRPAVAAAPFCAPPP
jgi:hypothetical protein